MRLIRNNPISPVLAAAVFGSLLFAAPAWAWEPPANDAAKKNEQDRPREPMAGPRRGPGERMRNMDPDQRREMRRRFMERHGGEPGDQDGPPRMGKEMVDWALEAIKAKLPRLHERLTKLRQEDPNRFEQVFRKLLPILKEYRELHERRPDLAETVLEEFQAEERLHELSREFLSAKDDAAKQASLAQEMETLVRKQFELRQKRFDARLEEFEERIKDQQLQLQTMKDRMTAMSSRQDEFIKRRVSQVKAGRMGEPVPGMSPGEIGGPGFGGPRGPMGGPGGPPPRGPGDGPPRGPGGRRPPPRDGFDGDGPPDNPPPPPDEGGGPPPMTNDGDS